MEEKVDFPYRPKRNIVIFGQRPAWGKVIKQHLKDVEIICEDTSSKNYERKISEADLVWIHLKVSHSFYGKVLKSCRKYKIEVKHFYRQGGKSCAREVYNYEEKGEYINYLTK